MTESAAMFVHRVQPRFPQRAHQRGAVLLVALIFLILLTLLAIGASSGSLLQQRMVAATQRAASQPERGHRAAGRGVANLEYIERDRRRPAM